MPRLSLTLLCSYYKNFPKAFIEKQKQTVPKKIFGNRFGAPDLVEYEIHPEEYDYTEHRPWEMDAQFHQRNRKSQRDKAAWWENNYRSWEVERPYRSKLTETDWTIFRGDRVQIMVGKDKGKHGVVRRIIRERDWCFVSGLNCLLLEKQPKIVLPRAAPGLRMDSGYIYVTLKRKEYKEISPPGYDAQLVLKERPLNYVTEEVRLVDPNDLKPTGVKWMWNDDGKRIRVSERTGEEIPIPRRESETYEYKSPETYIENPKDTREETVTDHTYIPALCTFEQELMEEYGIKEDRVHRKTYWY